MQIKFRYSADARKNYFVQTGRQLSEKGELECDPETLSPEQRELLYGQEDLTWYNDCQLSFNYPCTIADILAYLSQLRVEAEVKQEADIAEALALVDEWRGKTPEQIVADHSWQFSRWFHEIRHHTYSLAKKLLQSNLNHPLVDDAALQKIADTDRVIAEAKELRKDEDVRGKAAQERDEELREAKIEAEKQRKREEVAAWIEQYGDEQLKLAHANGYKCHRLYVTQRAALEYPGFILDFDDSWSYKERIGPSLAALQKLDEYPGTDATVVWINDAGDNYPIDDFEAIVIRKYLGKYDLILPITEGVKAIEETIDSSDSE